MFYIYFLVFLLASLLCFTIPLYQITGKLLSGESFFRKVVFSTLIGFILFTLFSYFLRVAHLSFILPVVIIPISLLNLKVFLKDLKEVPCRLSRKSTVFTVVLLLGIISQLAVIGPSSLILKDGMSFWSSLGHDGLWHIALIEELKKDYPLQNPVFSGNRLVNYHFFSDIAASDFSKYLSLSSLDLHFRFFPILLSFILGSLAYMVGVKVGKSANAGIWAMFFTYFAGSFGYIVTWYKDKVIGGESIFWSTQIHSSSGNPPQAAALVIFLGFFYLFQKYLDKPSLLNFALLVILGGSLAVFKVYAAVVLFLSLGLLGVIFAILKRDLRILFITFLGLLLSAILYLPNSKGSEQFLIFEPWWFIRTMVVVPERLNWLDMELRRQTYFAENNFKRVVQLELTAFLIFLTGNLGLRLVGFLTLAGLLKSFFKDYAGQLLIFICFFSLLLPMLFLQKGVAGNSIQFMQYLLLFMGILAGVTVAKIAIKVPFNSLKILFSLLIIIIAIPTQASLIYEFYKRPPYARISQEELTALSFLNQTTNPDSTILTPPYKKGSSDGEIPHIWQWSDTSYIPAISGRRTYLSDIEQVDIMGYQYLDRKNIQETIFKTVDKDEFDNLLSQNKINYLYFPKEQKPKLNLAKTNLKLFFENNLVEIWKIN